MRSNKNRWSACPAAWGLLLVVVWNVIGEARAAEPPAVTVAARVLDLPEVAADGSLRFHVEVESGKNDGPAARAAPKVAAVLFEDDFDSGRKTEWHDAAGSSDVRDGQLSAASDRNLIIVAGVREQDVRVSVEAEAAVQMGVLVRFQDAQNYVLAFFAPGARILGFHEVIKGQFGSWIQPVSTALVTGKTVHLAVEVRGQRINAVLSDKMSHTVQTRAVLAQSTGPGSVGLYHDTSVPGTQRFDTFRVSRLEPSLPRDAVEVRIPASAADENTVWAVSRRVRITGTEQPTADSGAARRTIVVAGVQDIVPLGERPADRTLFPVGLPGKRFLRFPAQALGAEPACGVVYRTEDLVTNGMPLGGVGTGCLDLETSGMLGYSTIFNTLVPRRGPMNVPLLGLSVGGQTWVLCDPQPKDGFGGYQHSATGRRYRLWRDGQWVDATEPITPVPMQLRLDGVRTAREIHYWGHYPVADLEFETDAPVGVGLRAYSPFLPGQIAESMLPGVVFAVHLRNTSGSPQAGTIAISFPGPLENEAGASEYARSAVTGAFRGVEVTAPLASYAIGVLGQESMRLGGELAGHGAAWAKIHAELPTADPSHSGASVAVDFSLPPGESQVVRFATAWYAPEWNAGGYHGAHAPHTFTHMYAKHYSSARQAAEALAQNHADYLRRILAWQEVVYAETSLPVWLRESLVNVLHLMTETALWAQAKPPLPDWIRAEDGLFGMNECPRGCPQIECIPCSFYGNQPLVYFFPQLALSTLRGYKALTSEEGAPPWIFGGCTGQTPPIDFGNSTRGYQWASNGISGAAMVDRFLICHDTPDRQYLQEFYPVIKQWMIWTIGLRKTPSYTIGEQVIAMPNPDQGETSNPPTEWFEAAKPGWAGLTAHIAGLHLAQLRITQRMAQQAGDAEFAAQCERWIKAGAAAMEQRLWTTGPQGGYYLNYFDPETGRKSDYIFGYQMDGEWITDHHGLPSALPPERVRTVLETIRQVNIALSRSGAVNYAKPDGSLYAEAEQGTWDYGAYSYFPPEALMLAMNYMYEGQREFGVELAGKVWHNLICGHGYSWDMPNIMRGDTDTGERTFGNDYYQNLMLWSLPAAVAGQDFGAPSRPGGLVHRMIQVARPNTNASSH